MTDEVVKDTASFSSIYCKDFQGTHVYRTQGIKNVKD